MSLRNVTKARDGKQGHRVRVTSRAGSALEILGDFEKVSYRVENWTPNETVDFRLLAEALDRCRTRWGGGR